MEVKNFLIGLVIFSMFSYAIYEFLGDMNQYYGSDINLSSYDVYKDQLTNLSGQGEELRANMQESGSDVQVSTEWDTSSVYALTGMKDIVFNSVPMAYSMFNNIVVGLGLPGWFWAGCFTILIVTISVMIMGAIFRWGV
jgi:hypothetical protein